MDTAACESYRGNTYKQKLGDNILQDEEGNKIFKIKRKKTEKRYLVKLRHLKAALYMGVLEETYAHTGPGSACLIKIYKSLHTRLISEALLLQSQLTKTGRGGSFFKFTAFNKRP